MTGNQHEDEKTTRPESKSSPRLFVLLFKILEKNALLARSAVAVSMTTDKEVLGIRLLDLAGEGRAREATSFGARLRAAIESFVESGSVRGIGVTEIGFERPPRSVRFELTDGMLVLALGD